MKGFLSRVKELGFYCGDKKELRGHFKRASDRIRFASRKMPVMVAMGMT